MSNKQTGLNPGRHNTKTTVIGTISQIIHGYVAKAYNPYPA